MSKITHDEPIQYQCRHIFTDGHRCASPTLRSPGGHEPFCYYHHTTRRPITPQDRVPRLRREAAKAAFTLPLPEDPSSIQHALGQVLQRIASNALDPRRAGLLLYGLQIASLNLKRNRQSEANDTEDTVTEITHDPDHGLLAPPVELHANQPIGSAQRLLMELGDVEELGDIDELGDIEELGDVDELGDVEELGDIDELGDVEELGDIDAEPVVHHSPATPQSNPPQAEPPHYELPPSDRPRSQSQTPTPASPATSTLDLQASAVLKGRDFSRAVNGNGINNAASAAEGISPRSIRPYPQPVQPCRKWPAKLGL